LAASRKSVIVQDMANWESDQQLMMRQQALRERVASIQGQIESARGLWAFFAVPVLGVRLEKAQKELKETRL